MQFCIVLCFRGPAEHERHTSEVFIMISVWCTGHEPTDNGLGCLQQKKRESTTGLLLYFDLILGTCSTEKEFSIWTTAWRSNLNFKENGRFLRVIKTAHNLKALCAARMPENDDPWGSDTVLPLVKEFLLNTNYWKFSLLNRHPVWAAQS